MSEGPGVHHKQNLVSSFLSRNPGLLRLMHELERLQALAVTPSPYHKPEQHRRSDVTKLFWEKCYGKCHWD